VLDDQVIPISSPCIVYRAPFLDSFRICDQPFSIASPTLNVMRCTANRREADLAGGIVDLAVGSILETPFSLMGLSRIQSEVSRRVYLLPLVI